VAIEDTIRDLHKQYRVCEVWYDPYQMQASAQRLRREGVPIEAFPQSAPNLTAASQNLYELIKGGNLVAYPDDAVRLAVSRAVAVETARGWRIAKDKQSHKIDVVVALAMAALAAVRAQSESTYHWDWGDDGSEEPEQFTGRRLLPWGGMPLIVGG
jgi:phage terminase large subunit-like protein